MNTAQSYLLKAFPNTSNMPLRHVKLIGSAAHGTIIRPVNDFDLMAVFNDPQGLYSSIYRNNSQAFIQRVKAAFSGCRIESIGVRGQAVRLFYTSGAHVDIAPVFGWVAGGYILPAGDGSWLRTNPDTQHLWFDEQDKRLSYHLKPLVRLLKRWNAVHGKQLKSFHLAVMVATAFITLGSNRADAVAKFFAVAGSYLDVNDPAGHSGNLASYLTPLARQKLLQRFSTATIRANTALAAEARGNHQEAMKLWAIEFGTEFPQYG